LFRLQKACPQARAGGWGQTDECRRIASSICAAITARWRIQRELLHQPEKYTAGAPIPVCLSPCAHQQQWHMYCMAFSGHFEINYLSRRTGCPSASRLRAKRTDRIAAKGWPKVGCIEHSPAGAPTWWAANDAPAEALLRSSGFCVLDRPKLETCWCGSADVADAVRIELDTIT
jgi:hypothetical protein